LPLEFGVAGPKRDGLAELNVARRETAQPRVVECLDGCCEVIDVDRRALGSASPRLERGDWVAQLDAVPVGGTELADQVMVEHGVAGLADPAAGGLVGGDGWGGAARDAFQASVGLVEPVVGDGQLTPA